MRDVPEAPSASSEPDWREGAMSINEAAAFLSLSRRTVYDLLGSGQLPSTKVRGRRLIPRAALINLLRGACD